MDKWRNLIEILQPPRQTQATRRTVNLLVPSRSSSHHAHREFNLVLSTAKYESPSFHSQSASSVHLWLVPMTFNLVPFAQISHANQLLLSRRSQPVTCNH
ncbi:HslU--HslV peptidase ATPase subunit [Sesbania bispinosa]|nr:HslU--HslV peptidase ATPase subunit [Sesbania bispinosa]